LLAVVVVVHQQFTEHLAQEHYLKLTVKQVLQAQPYLVIQQEQVVLVVLVVTRQGLYKVVLVEDSTVMVLMVDLIVLPLMVELVICLVVLVAQEIDVMEVIIMVAMVVAVAASWAVLALVVDTLVVAHLAVGQAIHHMVAVVVPTIQELRN
jgi:hypothetical protein